MDYEKYIGMVLDNRYELLEVIGVGGMAVVYKARSNRLNRLVAVKILKEEYSKDAEFRRRFYAESQAVAMLSHPNIVSVYDVNFTDQLQYIVMELIDGITLKQYMQSKKVLTWREALHFSTQIAKALSHAHSRGIIHRDIKPQNIMLLRDGTVKVADFGIARVTAKQNTLTQEALGSVHYVSPEQARGSHIDARSDLYSLGVVMYEMTTGRLPFEGDTPVSIAIQHINSIPLAPREINPDIPVGLEQIILHAMEPDMSVRYSSANELLKDIEEFRKNPMIVFPYKQSRVADAENINNPRPATVIPEAIGTAGAGTTVASVTNRNGGNNSAGVAPRRTGTQTKVTTPKNDDDDEKPKKNTPVIIAIVAVAALLLLLVVVAISVLNSGGSGNEIVMPDILHKNIDAVKEAFAESDTYNQLIIEENERVASEEYPEGTILEQYPPYGRSIKENATITVTVSSGSSAFELPEVSGYDYQEAQTILEKAGLTVAPLQYEYSEDVEEDKVIRTSPAGGSSVLPGDSITIYVSQGTEVQTTKVPDLLGHTENEVARLLQQANLIVGLATQVTSDEPAGTVVWQSIQADTEVDEKTSIDYRVSKGPAESPSPSPTETATPSPTPTPTPAAKTYTQSFDLPDGDGDVLVLVTLGDTVIAEETHQRSEGTFSVTYTLSSSSILKVYYDGALQYQLDVP